MTAMNWSANVSMILGYLAFWAVVAIAVIAEAIANHRIGDLLRSARRLVRAGFRVPPPPYLMM